MQDLIDYLSEFLLPRRIELFDEVLEQRTQYITIALEDIYQPQNASAVLRTCDCLGIQDIHIIEDKNEYRTDREVALGSSKWLNLIRYTEPKTPSIEAIKKLKEAGYRIIATCPHHDNVLLDDLKIEDGKMALFFGTELTGLTQTVLDYADEFVKIPMYGFTESYNISVSAAISLHHLTHKLRQSAVDWKLDPEIRKQIKLDWLRKSIKSSKKLEQKFHKCK